LENFPKLGIFCILHVVPKLIFRDMVFANQWIFSIPSGFSIKLQT